MDDDAAYFSPDEDQLSTTPLRMLQAIDLYERRLTTPSGAGPGAGQRSPVAELAGAALGGGSLPQLLGALQDLREDVEAYWSEGSDGEAC